MYTVSRRVRSAFERTYIGDMKTVLVVSVLVLLACSGRADNSTVTEKPPCPPWMKYEDGTCTCLDAYTVVFQRNFLQKVWCETDTQTTYVVSGTCATYSNNSSLDEGYVIIGDCPYTPLSEPNYYYGFLKPLPRNLSDLDAVMCDPFNRQGMLCSSCKPGYGIAVYSFGYPCAKCDAKIGSLFLYIMLETIPVTIFYVIVILFRVRATVPPLMGLVFLSNTAMNTLRFRTFIRTALIYSPSYPIRIAWTCFAFLSGIWRLDFLRGLLPPFCISEKLTNIDAALLEYVSAFYPLLLVLVTFIAIELHGYNVRIIVWLWKPFHRFFAGFRRTWDVRYSIVNAFSTFLLLSYSKILTTSFRLLYQTSIHNVNETVVGTGLHIDPTVQAFGSGLQSAISVAALFVIVVFSVLPLLLLLLYPTRPFQAMLRCCACRAKHAISLFVDTYQGCLKDGSNGTRDYRYVSALHFILRFYLLCIYIREMALLVNGVTVIIAGLVFIAISIFMVIFKPYKLSQANYSEFATFFVLGTTSIFLYIWIIFPHTEYIAIFVTICFIPHCIALCYLARWIGKRCKWNTAMRIWLKKYIWLCIFKRRECLQLKQDVDEEELPDRIDNPENYQKELDTDYERSET